MQQMELMHETLNDAAVSVVMSLGGYKKVGPQMRPELPQEQAANWLRDCLNPSRREKLDPEQMLLLMRLGRTAGVHSLAAFAMRDTGYDDPRPIDAEDERARLMRQFNESVVLQRQIAERMERLVPSGSGPIATPLVKRAV